MLNKIILQGRLVRDPELRHTAAGTPVASFSLAVPRNYSKDKETDFFDCIAWGHTGEFVSRNFTQGQLVCLDGRLQRRLWTSNEGHRRYSYEIIVESAYFAGSKANTRPAVAPADYDPLAYELAA